MRTDVTHRTIALAKIQCRRHIKIHFLDPYFESKYSETLLNIRAFEFCHCRSNGSGLWNYSNQFLLVLVLLVYWFPPVNLFWVTSSSSGRCSLGGLQSLKCFSQRDGCFALQISHLKSKNSLTNTCGICLSYCHVSVQWSAVRDLALAALKLPKQRHFSRVITVTIPELVVRSNFAVSQVLACNKSEREHRNEQDKLIRLGVGDNLCVSLLLSSSTRHVKVLPMALNPGTIC